LYNDGNSSGQYAECQKAHADTRKHGGGPWNEEVAEVVEKKIKWKVEERKHERGAEEV